MDIMNSVGFAAVIITLPVSHKYMIFKNFSGLCLMALGPEDNVAEYYQHQVEMLEGFNEMDALAERGFIPGMSKVILCSL